MRKRLQDRCFINATQEYYKRLKEYALTNPLNAEVQKSLLEKASKKTDQACKPKYERIGSDEAWIEHVHEMIESNTFTWQQGQLILNLTLSETDQKN